jgi:hypothetical protein
MFGQHDGGAIPRAVVLVVIIGIVSAVSACRTSCQPRLIARKARREGFALPHPGWEASSNQCAAAVGSRW